MKNLLLTILVGMFLATGVLSAKALGEGKMKASLSMGWKMATFEKGPADTTLNNISFAQPNGFAFLSPQAAGLAFSYGILKDLDVMFSMPLYSMNMITTKVKDMDDIDMSTTRTLGSPLLGVIYYKNLGSIGLRIAPYFGLPFIEMKGMSMNDKDLDLKDKDGKDQSFNFKQQIVTGLSLAIDSKMKGKMFWQAWLNLNMGFSGENTVSLESLDTTMFTTLSALIGYKIGNGQMTKLQLFWITPDLMNDTKDAKGFADGSLKIKAVYGMKLNKTSGFHAGLWTKMGFTDKAPMSSMGENTFVVGLTLDYWMKF